MQSRLNPRIVRKWIHVKFLYFIDIIAILIATVSTEFDIGYKVMAVKKYSELRIKKEFIK